MGFLTPWFLLGLLALAIPVLIHLVRRHQLQGMAFPSLMFIRQIELPERRRRQIRHWPLLALRCLGLALLVLAFARPFLPQAGPSALADERRERVILLDRSASMAYGDHAERAHKLALQALDELGPNDRAALVLFDQSAQIAGELGVEFNTLTALIQNDQPGAGATDLQAALARAAQLLSDSTAPQRDVILISDFQRSAAASGQDLLRLPSGVNLITQTVHSSPLRNAGLNGLRLHSERGQSERLRATAQLRNTGDEAIPELKVNLVLDGQEPQTRTLQLAANSGQTVDFDLTPPRAGLARASVRLDAAEFDALSADDQFDFVLAAEPNWPVLVVESSIARRHQSFYLNHALSLSQKPLLAIDIKSIDTLQSSDLDGRALIIWNDSALPGGTLGERLQRFVSSGGGLFIILADRFRGAWPGGDDGYLPGTLGRRVDRLESSGGSINRFADRHPLFAPFAEARAGDLANAQIWRYRVLNPGSNDRVLAYYDDGAAAVLERQYGAGRVLVLTTTLDTHWNNLALQPAFVPFMHSLARYLATYDERRAWFEVGTVVDIARYLRTLPSGVALSDGLRRGLAVTVKMPSGRQLRLDEQQTLLTLTERGFYELHSAVDPAIEMVLAANSVADESLLQPLDVTRFAERATGPAASSAATASAIPANPTSAPAAPSFWWYLVLAALFIFAAETWLSNRLGRTTHVSA